MTAEIIALCFICGSTGFFLGIGFVLWLGDRIKKEQIEEEKKLLMLRRFEWIDEQMDKEPSENKG